MSLMISCREASRALSQMQDGDVAFLLYWRLRLHLLLCEACTRFALQMRFLRRAMQDYRR
jgi:Putative zinc-finger